MKTLKTIYGIREKVLSTIAGLTLLALVASCSSDSSADGDDRMVSMPIVLAIPANETALSAAAGAKTTRAEATRGRTRSSCCPHIFIYTSSTHPSTARRQRCLSRRAWMTRRDIPLNPTNG